MKKILIYCLAAALVIGCGLPAFAAKKRFVTIGTGGVTGVYYPAGGAIAKMVNADRRSHGIRASVESTGGSVYNINAIISGDLEFGLAQSDRQYQAWNGLAEWEGKPQPDLRAVFSLHPEIVTLVASDESGIQSLADIKGKRVNIGSHGSGNRGNALDVLSTVGIDAEQDIRAESLKPAEAPKMLQDGRLDAFFYTVGHPNGAINEVTAGKRKVHFVPITGMDQLLSKSPYYAPATIPAGMYPMSSSTEDVASVGVMTTFVTSSAVSDDVVYALVKAVFEDLDAFKKLHPALANLNREDMLRGLSAPLHDGAKKYYEEQGLLRD